VRLPRIFESNSGILEKHSLETKKYFLFAGMISIRKNLLNLIKAYKESGMHKEYKLVLSGGASMGYDTIIAEVKKAGLEKNVLFPGFVSDNELSDLFINAKAFLFPTFYEGFGMPIIEAMHYNVPVLIGDRGAAPEVADNHAILSNPFDVDSIADGIKKVATMNDLSISNAANHAAKFTWEKCAKETMAVYNKIR
jgi:glycosyltransferase involved in cell wall biosynthesis